MANSEQVERLKCSVGEWNQWRQKYPEIRPDLSTSDLSKVNLIGADLSNANLREAILHSTVLNDANLRFAHLNSAILRDATLSHAHLGSAILEGANLSHANLNYARLNIANLKGANLRGTDFSHANLTNTNIRGADLRNADLSGTTLRGADFSEANLSSADLSSATLSDTTLGDANLTKVHFNHTIFEWVNLTSVRGLDTAVHDGPSTVNINSVVLPYDEHTCQHFLRGAGFSDTFIDYLPSLLTPSIQYYSLFISYSSRDERIAKRLYTDLQAKGVRCWFAPHHLKPGTPLVRGIEEAIRLHEKLLLILSKHAVKSAWIEREVDAALYQEIERRRDVLFPIRLDNMVLESTAGWAKRLRHRHIGDFTQWQEENTYQQAFATLLRHLKIDPHNALKHSP